MAAVHANGNGNGNGGGEEEAVHALIEEGKDLVCELCRYVLTLLFESYMPS